MASCYTRKQAPEAAEAEEQEKPGNPRHGKKGSGAFEKYDKPGRRVARFRTEAAQI